MRVTLALVVVSVGLRASVAAAAPPFSFVALGDTTYSIPEDNPLYERLIGAINAASPAFSIHVGDTKGYGDCGRAFQESQRAFFDSFKTAVFYTPGNNEWADCWKENRGSADPTEILKLMREVFYKEPKSRGAGPLPLVRQADADRDFAEFAENLRWTFGDVTFATLNLAGTYNNQELRVLKYWQEFARREEANLAWVKASFAAARAAGTAPWSSPSTPTPSTRSCATTAARSSRCFERSSPRPTISPATCSSSTATTTSSRWTGRSASSTSTSRR